MLFFVWGGGEKGEYVWNRCEGRVGMKSEFLAKHEWVYRLSVWENALWYVNTYEVLIEKWTPMKWECV